MVQIEYQYFWTKIEKFNKVKLIVDIQCDEIFLNPDYLDKAINFHLKNFNNYDVVIPHTLTDEKNNKKLCKNYLK